MLKTNQKLKKHFDAHNNAPLIFFESFLEYSKNKFPASLISVSESFPCLVLHSAARTYNNADFTGSAFFVDSAWLRNRLCAERNCLFLRWVNAISELILDDN